MITISSCFSSCNQAGSNVEELKSLIRHYNRNNEDSLKLKVLERISLVDSMNKK